MKLIIFILSIYLVALSCLPCADIEVTSAAHKASEMTSKHDKHSHDKDNDLCSPFCSCSCCGSQLVSYFKAPVVSFTVVSKSIKKPLPTYTSEFASNFHGSIWQPPKLV